MATTLRVTTAEPTAEPTGHGHVVHADHTPAAPGITDLLLLLMALIWGVNYIVAKFGTQAFAPLAFNAARIALATAVLWSIVFARGDALPTRRDALALLGLGVLGNGIYQIFFVEGLARSRASDTALVLAASPAFMAIIGRMRGVERVSARGVMGIVLSLGGIGLVVSGARHAVAGDSTALGYLLTVTACICWALYTVLLKPYTERMSGITLSAVTMTGGLAPMLLVGAPALVATRWGAVGPMAWAAIAYSGVLALVIAYFCWYRGVRVLGPTRASMYANLQPLFAMAVAWAVLGERPRAVQVAGAACIMTGLLLTRLQTASPAVGE
jgi:drug/metabolite transporter (DMT)-like permease